MFLQLPIDFPSPSTCTCLEITQATRHPEYPSLGKGAAVPVGVDILHETSGYCQRDWE